MLRMEQSIYLRPLTFLILGMGIVHGFGLIYSSSGKRKWLKAAGILLILSGIALISVQILAIISFEAKIDGTVANYDRWGTLMSSIATVFFILNFFDEKKTAEEEHAHQQQALSVSMNVVGLVALISVLVIAVRVSGESKWISDNPNFIPEHLKEIADPFEARVYVNNHGDSLRYRLMKPLEYDPLKKYPLVISLHGSSGRGTDNLKQIGGCLSPLLLSKQENRTKYPTFNFVPQCPPKSWWGGTSRLPGMDSLVIECVLALENEFSIDENRRYVAGYSLGGYGTWNLISKWPAMFAAAAPFAGGGNPALAQNVANVPVWAFHGAKDGLVPVSGSRDMIEAIKEAGGDPKYTEYPDKGHNISEDILATPEFLDWLFRQKRN